MRLTWLALLLAGWATSLAGCSSEDRRTLRCEVADPDAYYGTVVRRGKELTTLYVNNGDEPEYLDPTLAADGASTTLINDLFEGLASKHPKDVHPVQGVATHWDVSDDNTLWRFHLRPEAKWSDGKPVVAADFVYAWTRGLTAATGARNATILYPIKNGALFHQGKLKVLSRRERLRPKQGADGGESLPAGTALKIVAATKVRLARSTGVPRSADFSDRGQSRRRARRRRREEQGGARRARVRALGRAGARRERGGRAAPDDHTLEVELAEPTPYFLELVSYATLLSRSGRTSSSTSRRSASPIAGCAPATSSATGPTRSRAQVSLRDHHGAQPAPLRPRQAEDPPHRVDDGRRLRRHPRALQDGRARLHRREPVAARGADAAAVDLRRLRPQRLARHLLVRVQHGARSRSTTPACGGRSISRPTSSRSSTRWPRRAEARHALRAELHRLGLRRSRWRRRRRPASPASKAPATTTTRSGRARCSARPATTRARARRRLVRRRLSAAGDPLQHQRGPPEASPSRIQDMWKQNLGIA